MKTYLKDLTPEEVIRRLKAGGVVKYPDSKLEIKMIDDVICRFSEHEIVYGTFLTVCTYGAGCSEYYFETPDELKLEVGKCYKTRDGRKAFVSSYNSSTKYCRGAVIDFLNLAVWTENGLYLYATESGLDLVSEWSDDDVAED